MGDTDGITPPILLTLEEVRARLRIGRTTIYSLVRRGELDVIEVGGRRMVDPADLQRFVDENRRSRRRPEEAG